MTKNEVEGAERHSRGRVFGGRFRLYSTPESAEAGEVSALAILETVLACAVSAYVAFRFDTVGHIAAGMLVAPLLMLRTEESTRLGIESLNKFTDSVGGDELQAFVALMAMGPAAFLFRVRAVLVGARRGPRQSIAAIPTNWRRYCLSTDSLHPPEMVAGIEVNADGRLPRDTQRVGNVSKPKGTGGRLFSGLILTPILVFGFIPAMLYRWSLKSTAIVYLPLVWVTRTTIESGLSVAALLKRITKDDEIEKLRRWWSAFVLGVLGAKALYVFGWLSLEVLLERVPVPQGLLTDLLFQPNALPAWQYAAALNGLLTFGLFLFASRQLPYLAEDAKSWLSDTGVEHVVEAFAWSRGLVSFYSIGSVIYIFGVESFSLPLPPLGTGILP